MFRVLVFLKQVSGESSYLRSATPWRKTRDEALDDAEIAKKIWEGPNVAVECKMEEV